MTQNLLSPAPASPSRLATAFAGIVAKLDTVPYTALAIPLRMAVAWVFWSSALTHLANWETTLFLFADEYRVPLLPPEWAAWLGVALEVAAPIALLLGLGTRLAAAALLGMTTVIEVFVYPQAWPTHLQWGAMLLVLLCRGPGGLSLDAWIARRFMRARGLKPQSSRSAKR